MLRQRNGAHRAIAHTFAALDAFVHVRGWRCKADLFECVYRTDPNGWTRVVFGATVAVNTDHCVRACGLRLLRLAAEHLAPNTVTQVNTSAIYLFILE